MCITFLNFVSTFIEDLLAINMHSATGNFEKSLANGFLNLAEKSFSPRDAIKFVGDLFKPYFKGKNLALICEDATINHM